MSTGHSFTSPLLEPVGGRVPWQFRARPALFVTVSSIVAILVAISGLIVVRRLTGALTSDLPSDVMLITALATAVALAFARIAWRRSFPLETPADLSFMDRAIGWGSSTAPALLAVGCCYPANRTSDWLIWLPILVADQLWRQNFFDAGEPWMPASDDEQLGSPILAISDSPAYEPESDIVQQLYRLQDDRGPEEIYGTLRADFVAGQRTAVVHVGFCPPLAYLPEIEAEALPGFQAKVKVVQALAHGARLDIRLPAPAPADIQLWLDMAARPLGMIAELKTA